MNPESTPPTPLAPPDSLDWLAFRYIADEMSADERETFESRLAEDQTAREAVALVVEVAQAVSLVEPAVCDERVSGKSPPVIVARADGRTWLTAFGWMIVGSLACVAVLLVAEQWSKQRVDQVRQVARSTGDDSPPQLAMVWSETRRAAEPDNSASQDAASEGTEFSLEAHDDLAEEPAWSDPMSPTPAETPSWMIAAVAEDGVPAASSVPAPPATASPAKEP